MLHSIWSRFERDEYINSTEYLYKSYKLLYLSTVLLKLQYSNSRCLPAEYDPPLCLKIAHFQCADAHVFADINTTLKFRQNSRLHARGGGRCSTYSRGSVYYPLFCLSPRAAFFRVKKAPSAPRKKVSTARNIVTHIRATCRAHAAELVG